MNIELAKVTHLAARLTVSIFVCSAAFSAISALPDRFRDPTPEKSKPTDKTIVALCYASALLALFSTMNSSITLLYLHLQSLNNDEGSPRPESEPSGSIYRVAYGLAVLFFVSAPSLLCGAVMLFIWSEFESDLTKGLFLAAAIISAILWAHRTLSFLLLFFRSDLVLK